MDTPYSSDEFHSIERFSRKNPKLMIECSHLCFFVCLFVCREPNLLLNYLLPVIQVLEQQIHPFTTTMFDSSHVLFLKSCVIVMPNVTGHIPSKKFCFYLVSPRHISLYVLVIKVFLKNAKHVTSVFFTLKSFHWFHFLCVK